MSSKTPVKSSSKSLNKVNYINSASKKRLKGLITLLAHTIIDKDWDKKDIKLDFYLMISMSFLIIIVMALFFFL